MFGCERKGTFKFAKIEERKYRKGKHNQEFEELGERARNLETWFAYWKSQAWEAK